MDREAWHAVVHGGHKELDMTELLNRRRLLQSSSYLSCSSHSFIRVIIYISAGVNLMKSKCIPALLQFYEIQSKGKTQSVTKVTHDPPSRIRFPPTLLPIQSALTWGFMQCLNCWCSFLFLNLLIKCPLHRGQNFASSPMKAHLFFKIQLRELQSYEDLPGINPTTTTNTVIVS